MAFDRDDVGTRRHDQRLPDFYLDFSTIYICLLMALASSSVFAVPAMIYCECTYGNGHLL